MYTEGLVMLPRKRCGGNVALIMASVRVHKAPLLRLLFPGSLSTDGSPGRANAAVLR